MPTVHAVVVWWDLSASSQTIESLRQYLAEESVPAFSQVPGLRFKMWISDARANLWGAVLLWESAAAAQQPLPSRAAQLIGYPPALSREFDVEATTEGRYEVQQLALQGLACRKRDPRSPAQRVTTEWASPPGATVVMSNDERARSSQ